MCLSPSLPPRVSPHESEGMGGGFEGGREGERNTGAGCPAAFIGGDLAATASVLLGGRARGSPPAPRGRRPKGVEPPPAAKWGGGGWTVAGSRGAGWRRGWAACEGGRVRGAPSPVERSPFCAAARWLWLQIILWGFPYFSPEGGGFGLGQGRLALGDGVDNFDKLGA